MSPQVSILLPSYNHAEFLPACIGSIMSQTFADWELIAIDDGSGDDSLAVLNELADKRCRVSQNPSNLGTYGTLQRALSEAKAPFIAVMNSDDIWTPEKLNLQVRALTDSPGLPLAYTLGWRIDENGGVDSKHDVHENWPIEPEQELLPFLLTENRVLASSVMFRREHARFVPELRYSGDWAALLGPAKDSAFALVPQRLTFWRMHSHNTFRRSAGQVAEEIWIRESILADTAQWNVPRVPSLEIRRGLGVCAMHLASLYVLQGRMPDARKTARSAFRLFPSNATLRRLATVSLLPPLAHKRLWGSEPAVTPEPRRKPLAF